MAGERHNSREQRRGDRPPSIGESAVAGLGAFAIGYVLMYVLRGSEIMTNFWTGFRSTGASRSQLESVGLQPPEKWQVVGWVYHQVHNAQYRVAVSGARDVTRTTGRDFLSGDLVPWLIPMAALAAGGFLLVTRVGTVDQSLGARHGARIAVGYAIAAAVTAFVFEWSGSVSGVGGTLQMSIRPDLASSLLFTGLLYPAVFGAVGGYVAAGRADGGARRARPGRAGSPADSEFDSRGPEGNRP